MYGYDISNYKLKKLALLREERGKFFTLTSPQGAFPETREEVRATKVGNEPIVLTYSGMCWGMLGDPITDCDIPEEANAAVVPEKALGRGITALATLCHVEGLPKEFQTVYQSVLANERQY